MGRIQTIVRILTLCILVGQGVVLPSRGACKDLPPAVENKAAAEKAGVKNLRCPDNQPLTDEIVAKNLNVSVERLKALKAARSLTNEQVCSLPDKALKRALSKLDRPKADKPGEWAEFRNLQRRSDDGKVKADGLIRGFEHRKAVLRRAAEKRAGRFGAAATPGAQQAAAEQAGTAQIVDVPISGVATGLAGIAPDQWTPLGPGNVGGRIRAIAIHPVNTSSMWVGSVAGGIWHSADRGESWSPVNDFMANLAISSIIIDPSDADTMYAGTGEGFFNADAVRGYGVFKSTDGGATWNLLTSTIPSTDIDNAAYGWYWVNRLAVSSDGNTILAATQGYYPNWGSIWRSTDGGATWSLSYNSGRLLDVRFDPNDSTKALATALNYNFTTSQWESSILKSVNGGQTWKAQKTFSSRQSRIELAYAKSNSLIVYASIDNNSGEIWKSNNGGTTWARTATPQHLGNQGWYDNTIWVDPTNPSLVVAAGLDIWRSTNGGTTWTKISNWANNMYNGYPWVPHADHHALVSDPHYNGTTNKTLYNGNDGGLFRALDISLATETGGWENLNHDLAITQFFSVAGHTSAGTRIIGGTQDNGSLMNAGPATDWKLFNGGDGGFSAVDATNDNYLYGEYVYLQICRSSDRGTSTTDIDKTGSNQITDSRQSSGANFIAPFILDPNDGNRMLGGGLSLWQNQAVRAGTSWTAVKASTGSKISAIAVAEGNSAIAWVGHNSGAVYRTANSLHATPTWTQVSGSLGQARMVNRILIDKDDPNKVYVAFGGYNNNNLYLTTDNGATWTDMNSPARVLPSVPFFGLARHPSNANWLYVGTEVGLFTSQDGGTTWSTSNDGPANVEISELAWRDNTTLLAATHGRGMFLATVSAMTDTTMSVAANINPSAYGQSVIFTATVSPSTATGTVTFMDGATMLGTATLSGGTAGYGTTSLSTGNHSITAVYAGDSIYRGSTTSEITHMVNKANTNMSVVSSLNPSDFGQTVTFTVTVAPTSATGTVTFMEGATTLGTAILIGGTATFGTSALSVGSHGITAAYSGDGNHNGQTCLALTQTVVDTTQPNTAVNSGPAGPTNATTAFFTFSGEDDVTPAASLTFECSLDGGTLTACTSPATYTVGAGGHNFRVRAVDAAKNADQTPAGFDWSVDLAPPDTIIDSMPVSLINSTSASFTFHATEPDSTLECNLDSAGFALCASPMSYTVAEGSHNFQVRAVDVANNADQTPAGFSWTVDTTVPDTVIDSAPPAFTNSNSPTFAFHATEGSTFTCKLDGNPPEGCSSPKMYPGVGGGSHTFTVTAADAAGNPDPSAASFTWTIDTIAPVTSITSGPVDGSTTTDTSATFEFTGTDNLNPPENLSFECNIDSGAFAPCTSPRILTGLSYGFHSFAVRAKDQAGNTNASTAGLSWTVTQPATTSAITSSLNPSTYGQSVAFTTTVSPSTATGTVTFMDGATTLGSTTLSDGSATYIASALSAGSHGIIAVYAGDGSHIGSTSTVLTQIVNKATPTVGVWPTASAIIYGQPLSGSTLTEGTASVTGGFAFTMPFTKPNAGPFIAPVTFTPADTTNYKAVGGSVTVTVNPAPLTVTAAAKSKTYGAVDPALSYTATGFVNSETSAALTGSLTRAAGEPVVGSPYAITQGTLAGSNYSITYTGASLTINKATPAITWNNPDNVTFGTSLSAIQLNASTGSVAGTSIYTPPAGTILGPGSGQTLSVSFTPSDLANCTTATTTVTINVLDIDPAKAVWVDPGTLFYATIGSAYQGAGNGVDIKVSNLAFTENLVFNLGKTETLSGGYNSDFTSNSGLTTIVGTLTINSGAVTISNIVIK